MALNSSEVPGAGLIAGHVGSIVANAVMLFVARNALAWRLPFLTPAWADVLWAVELSLYAAIVASAVLLSYDAVWFRHLAAAIQGGFALQAGYWIWAVYPFDFGASDELFRLVTLLVMVAIAISVVVAVFAAVVELLREPFRA